MDIIIAIIEDYLSGSGISIAQLALGVTGFSLLITLLTLLSSGRKASKLAKTLAKSRVEHEQLQAQSAEQLQLAQAQVEQMTAELQQKDDDLAQQQQSLQNQITLAQELQQQIDQHYQNQRQFLLSAANDFSLQAISGSDAVNALENAALWPMQIAVIEELAGQAQAHNAAIAKLTAKGRSDKARIDKLELAKLAIVNALNQAALQNRQKAQALTAELAQQQTQTVALTAENLGYKATITSLEMQRLSVFDELNQAKIQRSQLQTELADKQQQLAEATQTIVKLQAESQADKNAMAQAREKNAQALADANQKSAQVVVVAAKVESQPLVEAVISEPEEDSKKPQNRFSKFMHTSDSAKPKESPAEVATPTVAVVTAQPEVKDEPPVVDAPKAPSLFARMKASAKQVGDLGKPKESQVPIEATAETDVLPELVFDEELPAIEPPKSQNLFAKLKESAKHVGDLTKIKESAVEVSSEIEAPATQEQDDKALVLPTTPEPEKPQNLFAKYMASNKSADVASVAEEKSATTTLQATAVDVPAKKAGSLFGKLMGSLKPDLQEKKVDQVSEAPAAPSASPVEASLIIIEPEQLKTENKKDLKAWYKKFTGNK